MLNLSVETQQKYLKPSQPEIPFVLSCQAINHPSWARLKLIYRLKMVNSMFWPRAQPVATPDWPEVLQSGLWNIPWFHLALPACPPADQPAYLPAIIACTLTHSRPNQRARIHQNQILVPNLPVRVWPLSCPVCPSKSPIHLVDLNYVTLVFRDSNSLQACCNFCFSLSRQSCILSLSSGCSAECASGNIFLLSLRFSRGVILIYISVRSQPYSLCWWKCWLPFNIFAIAWYSCQH